MMKHNRLNPGKPALLAAAVLLMLLLAASACADTLPTVSFAAKTGSVNCGRAYLLQLKASAPFAADTRVEVVCDDTAYAVTFPAGAKEAALEIPTPKSDTRGKMIFTLKESADYQAQKSARHTLVLQPMPKVSFYLLVNVGFLNRNMSVIVECANSATVLKDCNTFELRDQTGRVFCTKQWKNPANRLTFSFPVTEDMLGRHDFSVWLDGECVSPMTGYGAISDPSVQVVKKLDPGDLPYMCVTLDCAYDDHNTDLILETLDKYQVKATFFMTGYFYRVFPDSVKKILEHGHTIGNHSNTHRHLASLNIYSQLLQIQTPTKEMEELFGVRYRLYRPPFGEVDKNVVAMARAEGQEVIMWTIDSHDWDPEFTQPEVVKRVKRDVTPGTIVLFHLDGFGTPKTLDEVIPYYQNELGLKLVTVPELMEASGRELPPLMQTSPAAQESDAE